MNAMYIILHNPLSKNKKSKRTTKKLVDDFKRRNIPFRLKSLLKIKDLIAYLEKAQDNVEIILLGGDGTINNFVNQTMNYPIKQQVYLKSNGSGNDFLRTLKLKNTPHQTIMQLIHDGKTQYFLNGAGIGIDGTIGLGVNQATNKSQLRYLMVTLKSLITYKPQTLELTLDGKTKRYEKAYLMTANNGCFIGGGMKITPHAQLDDAWLDVLVVHNVSRVVLVMVFLTIYMGLHLKFKKFIYNTKAKHVKASMFSKQVAQCDGECFENTETIEVFATDRKAHFKLFTGK